MAGLGDPLQKLLGRNSHLPDVSSMIAALEQEGEVLKQALAARLDADWARYNLKGAALVYAWPALREGLSAQVFADDAENYLDWLGDEEAALAPPQPVAMLRALDLSLVLNVLSRANSLLLLVNEPLFFEYSYWKRRLVTDDTRLVALAQATGCKEMKA
jgi:hypothetical protein